jgi:hypothetical protein
MTSLFILSRKIGGQVYNASARFPIQKIGTRNVECPIHLHFQIGANNKTPLFGCAKRLDAGIRVYVHEILWPGGKRVACSAAKNLHAHRHELLYMWTEFTASDSPCRWVI